MFRIRWILLACLVPVVASAGGPAELTVVGLTPARHTAASVSTSISIDFDRPVAPSSVDAASFRVFGLWSGPSSGTFSFSNADQTVTFTPAGSFSAGEPVFVNLSHDLVAADAAPLRAAGYFYSFMTAVVPGAGAIQLQQIDVISNLGGDPQTRIYGAAASDLNNDGWLDLATVNETSADIRVALNRADGTGLFQAFLPRAPIGIEASPNAPADFDSDGNVDLCVAATGTDDVWILLGNGDGTFGSTQSVTVGQVPHGIAVLDVDGDADWDIVCANLVSADLSLMINDGAGVFGSAVSIAAGVNGPYGLASADMNEDGIEDLVVAGRNGQEVRALLGNGDGTFTAAAAQTTSGSTWVVVLGDANGDGHLDAATANSFSNTVSVLAGNGDGTFGLPSTFSTAGHTPAVDLGDLDGDGDADLVASSFGAGLWRIYENDGTGSFSFVEDIAAPSNPSCAVLFDSDNDGDLDVALTDEIDDVIVLMENVSGASSVSAGPTPGALNLAPNVPNPFTGSTRIRFLLPEIATSEIDVFDVLGRRVASYRLPARTAGWQSIEVSARDDTGEPLAPGVYLYRVRAADREATGRMVRIR